MVSLLLLGEDRKRRGRVKKTLTIFFKFSWRRDKGCNIFIGQISSIQVLQVLKKRGENVKGGIV